MHYMDEEEEEYWRDEEDEEEDKFWGDDWQFEGTQTKSKQQKRSER